MKPEDVKIYTLTMLPNGEDARIFRLDEFTQYDKYKFISRVGGLGWRFADHKKKYFHKDNFDTYGLVYIKDDKVGLIFTAPFDFDCALAMAILLDHERDRIMRRVEYDENSLHCIHEKRKTINVTTTYTGQIEAAYNL